jgi:CRP-like cAMP-binding protein
MSDREIVDFLATVPLLEDQQEANLVELARVMRRRTLREGQIVWRQGDDAGEMLVIVEGCLSALLDMPGDRTVEVARMGPGETVGEIGLLGGDGRATSIRATETTTVLALGQLDFTALVAGQHPSAFSLRRRLALLLTMRVRAQVRHLSVSLGGEIAGPVPKVAPRDWADLEECRAPDSKYVRRMATFHDFEPAALWGFLTSGSYVM